MTDPDANKPCGGLQVARDVLVAMLDGAGNREHYYNLEYQVQEGIRKGLPLLDISDEGIRESLLIDERWNGGSVAIGRVFELGPNDPLGKVVKTVWIGGRAVHEINGELVGKYQEGARERLGRDYQSFKVLGQEFIER